MKCRKSRGSEISGKTSQDPPHPRKSRAKPRKIRPIPGNPGKNLTRCAQSPEIPEETSQNAPHPRKSRKKPHKMRAIPGNPGNISEKNLTKRRLCCCWLLSSDKLCRGPLRVQKGNSLQNFRKTQIRVERGPSVAIDTYTEFRNMFRRYDSVIWMESPS